MKNILLINASNGDLLIKSKHILDHSIFEVLLGIFRIMKDWVNY